MQTPANKQEQVINIKRPGTNARMFFKQNNLNNNDMRKQKTELFKVYRVSRKTARKTVLERNLTREQAKRLVNSFPDSDKSMVCFTKQY